jgi:hypothetical protein
VKGVLQQSNTTHAPDVRSAWSMLGQTCVVRADRVAVACNLMCPLMVQDGDVDSICGMNDVYSVARVPAPAGVVQGVDTSHYQGHCG